VLADNSAQLITAARARSLDTLGRAERALAAAEALGQPLSVSEFATRAGVSRAWFYGQPHLRERLRMIGPTQRGNQHRSKPDDAARGPPCSVASNSRTSASSSSLTGIGSSRSSSAECSENAGGSTSN
jgi:hypothetical protein